MEYKDISIKTYKEISDIVKDYLDTTNTSNTSENENKYLEDINLKIDLISVLFEKTKQEIYDMKAVDFQELCDRLSFLMEKPKVTGKIPDSITINGNSYRVMKKIDKFNTGQFIDLNNYITTEAGLEYILSTILIPKKHKDYMEGYELDDILNDMESVDILTALNLNAFFLRKLQVYSKRLRTYLGLMTMWKTRKMPKEMRKETWRKIRSLLSEVNGNTCVS